MGVAGIGVYKETPNGSDYKQAPFGCQGISPAGLAIDSNGVLYVVDTNGARVVKETASTTCNNLVTVASGFVSPYAVAVDGCGNVFVGAAGVVYRETPSGSGYKQTARAGFRAVNGLGVISSGGFYVGAGASGVYLAVPAANNESYTGTVVGGGWTTASGVATDGLGDLYVVDTAYNRIWKLPSSTLEFGGLPVGTTSPVFAVPFSIDATGPFGGSAVITSGVTAQEFQDAGAGNCTASTLTAGNICWVNVTFSPTVVAKAEVLIELKDGLGSVAASVNGTGTGVPAGSTGCVQTSPTSRSR